MVLLLHRDIYAYTSYTLAVCCSVLQCVAVCCGVLQCVAVCRSMLQCVAVCCSVLHCVAVCCGALTQRALTCGVCIYIHLTLSVSQLSMLELSVLEQHHTCAAFCMCGHMHTPQVAAPLLVHRCGAHAPQVWCVGVRERTYTS